MPGAPDNDGYFKMFQKKVAVSAALPGPASASIC